MGQAQINVRTRACSRTSIARTKQAALTHNVRGKELRWMSGVTKLDRIRNERIRGTTKVGEMSKKVQESRLKWYGHVLRREEEYVGKILMVMEVPGKRRRGRPKRR